jgi:hypothetical protein
MKKFDEVLALVEEIYWGRRPRPALTLVPHGGEVS